MRTFVMGDIHGAHKALVQCLERSEFDPVDDRLIQLGDIVDRFPDSYECVETLLTLDRLIAIRGNHDIDFWAFLDTGYHGIDFAGGGLSTGLSYARHCRANPTTTRPIYTIGLSSDQVPASHKDFFKHQRYYFVDDKNRCYVHGGFRRELPMQIQRELDFLWDRSLWHDALYLPAQDWEIFENFTRIFIGHTNTVKYGKDTPMFAKNVINVDTGAGGGGRLTIMNVDTLEYWQSDPVAELYPGH